MGKNGGLNVNDTTTVVGTGVRVRESPIDGSVLYSAGNGNRVEVLAKRDCSDGFYWYRIDNLTLTGKPAGWMRGDFLANSSGSGSGGDSAVPGVDGDGPNSVVSADDIRNGVGVWKKDLKTKHPQIKSMQHKLNDCAAEWGRDIGSCGTPDGVFGDKTAYMVRWFQGLRLPESGYSSGFTQDGIVGIKTMGKIDNVLL